ncbi:ScyD/ScyE family protein [Microbacterium capsulatum]|uniref:ScyD/ScyE family protein n=1 Tax=Microbacterium capsulatum TaxID=3041921 RepID=A0ABU0XG12_9MICO|nr:ScyD/ScyE family protein [Microbacterium sp. ASV81]MDQ4212630.1 ScyD/ScyE family protein [Microbacterium sp. ASV81]
MPFSIAVDGPRVLIADGGTGTVGQLQPDGSITPVVTGVDGVAGVAVRGKWLAYTSTHTDFDTFTNTASGLNIRTPQGTTVYADTHAFERANNPDQINTYGVASADPCVQAVLGPQYTGGVDSHAYNVASWNGRWIVADAGANALLTVDDAGTVSTLAVLPPQPAEITAEVVAALGMPDCVAGVTYAFEPVPTDVEVGADGMLYVTTLPGGPESAALGARGSVYRVDPNTGVSGRVATGFLGATNLAIGKNGEIYVTELFGGQVSVLRGGVVSPFAALPGAVSVATGANGRVWVATMANEDPAAPGTIVSISNGKVKVQGKVTH